MDARHLQVELDGPYARWECGPYPTKSKVSTPQHPPNSKVLGPSAQSRDKLREVTPYYRLGPNLFATY